MDCSLPRRAGTCSLYIPIDNVKAENVSPAFFEFVTDVFGVAATQVSQPTSGGGLRFKAVLNAVFNQREGFFDCRDVSQQIFRADFGDVGVVAIFHLPARGDVAQIAVVIV